MTWFKRTPMRRTLMALVLAATVPLAACGDGHPGGSDSSSDGGTTDGGTTDGGTTDGGTTDGGTTDGGTTDGGTTGGGDGGAGPGTSHLSRYVHPLIGTSAADATSPVSTGKGGSVVPAAGLPRGMVQWAPDTNTTARSDGSPAGYYYDEGSIKGFSLTHMNGAGGSGNDGELPVMPTTDLGSLQPTFRHENETAAAGYYAVLLDTGIKAELTATLRTGFGRFTYPASQSAFLVLDATRTNTMTTTTGSITREADNAISGSTLGGNFHSGSKYVTIYFYAAFDQDFGSASSFDGGIAKLAFASGATVQMKIGLSYVSVGNARENLESENAGWDFDAVHTAAAETWNTNLALIEVRGGTDEQLTKFYTALYRTMWAPRVFSDVNGQYIGFDGTTHAVNDGQGAQYTAFSGWDVYRSLIPLQALLFPRETSDAMQSLVNFADQCGAIPHWVSNNADIGIMPGDAGSLMVAGAYAFGARNFDAARALDHMIKMANVPGTACSGTNYNGQRWSTTTNGGRSDYLKYGYITSGETGTASSTLEYEGSDFAIARFAQALGGDQDAAYGTILLARTASWKNLLNASLSPPLIAGRSSAGAWVSETQRSTDNYTQGNAEQYTWMVPHDLGALTSHLGAPTTVASRLDTFFTYLNGGTSEPYFYMGNEPTFQVPWTYNWVGAPARTQAIVQRIADEAFGTGTDGLAGNDDLGALSGWYVWASLGLYPVIPGVGGLSISSPQFSAITVHLGNGKTLQIDADGAPTSNYIQALRVNDVDHASTWLPLADISGGATLTFTMGGSASTWGAEAGNAPPSYPIPGAASAAEAYNTNGISADGETNADGKGAAIDGSLNSYSETALANAGMTPGATITVDGASFQLPDPGARLDTILCVGQTIEFASATASSKLVFLGMSTNGPSTGTATITYTDGTTESFTLGLDDNTIGASATPTYATGIAARTTYRNTASGTKATSSGNVYAVFYFSKALDGSKVVARVTLPAQVSKGRMRLFGIALAP